MATLVWGKKLGQHHVRVCRKGRLTAREARDCSDEDDRYEMVVEDRLDDQDGDAMGEYLREVRVLPHHLLEADSP